MTSVSADTPQEKLEIWEGVRSNPSIDDNTWVEMLREYILSDDGEDAVIVLLLEKYGKLLGLPA